MESFFRAAALVMVAVVLGALLDRDNKHMAMALMVIVCCVVAGAAFAAFSPVIALLEEFKALGNLEGDTADALFKALGIGVVTQIAVLICHDAANAALGKTLQLLGTVAILSVSVPLLRDLLQLIQRMLGEL